MQSKCSTPYTKILDPPLNLCDLHRMREHIHKQKLQKEETLIV